MMAFEVSSRVLLFVRIFVHDGRSTTDQRRLMETPSMPGTPLQLRNFIGGEFVDARGEEMMDLLSPVSTKVVAKAPMSVQADVDAAYVAAEQGFAEWGQVTPAQRQQALLKFADAIEDHADDLVRLDAQNTGKPWALTASEEVPPMVDQLRFGRF